MRETGPGRCGITPLAFSFLILRKISPECLYENKWQRYRAQCRRQAQAAESLMAVFLIRECEYPTSVEPCVCALLPPTMQS